MSSRIYIDLLNKSKIQSIKVLDRDSGRFVEISDWLVIQTINMSNVKGMIVANAEMLDREVEITELKRIIDRNKKETDKCKNRIIELGADPNTEV